VLAAVNAAVVAPIVRPGRPDHFAARDEAEMEERRRVPVSSMKVLTCGDHGVFLMSKGNTAETWDPQTGTIAPLQSKRVGGNPGRSAAAAVVRNARDRRALIDTECGCRGTTLRVFYSILLSILLAVVSAAARLQPMRRSFTSCKEKAPSLPRGAVTAKKSARSTPVR
jgi:hypothetical protein